MSTQTYDGDRSPVTGPADPGQLTRSAPPAKVGRLRSPVTGHRSADPLGAAVAYERVERWGTLLLTGAVTLITAEGQIGFAHWGGIPDPIAWFTPAIFELAMALFLVRGYLRARDEMSPLLPWALALGIGGLAIYAQVVHAATPGAAIAYGSASLVCTVLWFWKLYDAYCRYLVAKGKRPVRRPKFGALNWALSPARCWRGLLISIAIQDNEVEPLQRLAITWRSIYRSARLRKVRRPMAKITAWNAVYRAAGLPGIELPSAVIAEVTLTHATPVAALTADRSPDPGGSADRSGDRRVIGQRTGHPRGPVTARPSVSGPATVTDPGQPARRPAVSGSRGTRSADPYLHYRDAISAVQAGIPDWRTRAFPVTSTEIELHAGVPGKGTRLIIRDLIETLADRDPVSAVARLLTRGLEVKV